MKIKIANTKENHEVWAPRHGPCSPQARWGDDVHSHEASTTKAAEDRAEEAAAEASTVAAAAAHGGDGVQHQSQSHLAKRRGMEGSHKQLYDDGGGFAGKQGSELAGAAGVALEQAHDGRVALGPAYKLLQRQFPISVGVHLAEYFFCPFLWG